MIAAKIGTIPIGIGGLGRGCFGTLNGHGLVIEYCWVRVHDRRLERFPLRIAGHCLKTMLIFFRLQLGNSFYNSASISRTIYVYIYTYIQKFQSFQLFKCLTQISQNGSWYLISSFTITTLRQLSEEEERLFEMPQKCRLLYDQEVGRKVYAVFQYVSSIVDQKAPGLLRAKLALSESRCASPIDNGEQQISKSPTVITNTLLCIQFLLIKRIAAKVYKRDALNTSIINLSVYKILSTSYTVDTTFHS